MTAPSTTTRTRRPRVDGTRRPEAGLTLVEMLIALTILAIASVFAIPTFDNFRVRERLKGAATNLYTDMQYARSEAVQRNTRLTVSFVTGAGWCYGINAGNAPCDCTAANDCDIKQVSGADFPGIAMTQAEFDSASGTANWYAIDPRRGQVVDAAGAPVDGNVLFSGAGSRALRGDLNAVGRVRLCSPSGSISGYPTC